MRSGVRKAYRIMLDFSFWPGGCSTSLHSAGLPKALVALRGIALPWWHAQVFCEVGFQTEDAQNWCNSVFIYYCIIHISLLSRRIIGNPSLSRNDKFVDTASDRSNRCRMTMDDLSVLAGTCNGHGFSAAQVAAIERCVAFEGLSFLEEICLKIWTFKS